MLLERFYGPGFLSVCPLFSQAVYHRERCVVRVFLWTGFSLSASSVVMLCVTGNVVLLERSYGLSFLSVRPVFYHAVYHREHCVFLERSYGPGFLSERPVFYHAVYHTERCVVRVFLRTGFSLSASSVPHAVCHMGSCVFRAFFWTGFSLSTSSVLS